MPRSPSRNDRDRRDRDRDRLHSSKDHSSDVAKMKEKMRNNLESARSSSQFSAKKTEKSETLSAEEHLARTKVIEQIEEGAFQPGSFRSGSAAKKDQKAKQETSHDAAIFGPAWKSAEQRKVIEKKESNVATISLPSAPTPPMNAMAPMVPSYMHSENAELRKADWKVYWTSLRNELLQQGY
ncbi:unnamed protein product [Caenorhabditis sp. 36 PRJEB53466]|nr:unnamed protein product [Caenorhabditis sp. 36 PRJEB53466]